MRLADAARYFDKTLCQDAVAPATSFLGQLDLFDDSKRDGATVARRVLSVAPSVVMPASRLLLIAGEVWIVGAHQMDAFRGQVVRDKHIIHRAVGAAALQTIGQTLSTGGTPTYAGKLWVKDFKEQEISSTLEGFFNLYLPQGAVAPNGSIVSVAGRLHMVRNSFVSAAGFLVAECSELAVDALVSATYSSMVYSPLTDTEVPTNTAVNLLRVRFQDDYAYSSESSPKLEPGDIKGYVRKAVITTAKVNHKVTVGATPWRVQTVSDEGDCWGLHLRHAGA